VILGLNLKCAPATNKFYSDWKAEWGRTALQMFFAGLTWNQVDAKSNGKFAKTEIFGKAGNIIVTASKQKSFFN